MWIQPTNATFPSNRQIPPKLYRDRNPQQSPQVTQPLPPALSRPLTTPIKTDKLQTYLEGYPPRSRQYLIEGFRFGFSIDYVGHRSNFESKNLLSATTNPVVVDEKLAKEIQLGRIVGPFDGHPFPVFHVSPLGLIPKKVPGEFRLIHHLSFPERKSINSHIQQIASSVHYANIDDAIRLIRRTGRGCALAKTDIKNSGRKNVMSMRQIFCPDPPTGFEKMAGFQIFYCLKIKCVTHNLERTGNLSSKVASCGYNLVVS